MKHVSAAAARRSLVQLIEEVSATDEPIEIRGPRGEAVLVSEAHWRGIQETLYLLSIPGMKESILEAAAAPIEECDTAPGW